MKIPFLNVHIITQSKMDQINENIAAVDDARIETFNAGYVKGYSDSGKYHGKEMRNLVVDNVVLAQRNILLAKKLGYKQ